MAAVQVAATPGFALDFIAQWVAVPANSARILRARQLQGGWEVWAQVEIAFDFMNNNRYPGQISM